MSQRQTKNKKAGFPYLTVIVSSTLSLFVFGYLCSLSLAYYKLQDELKSNVRVNFYLENSLTNADLIHVKSRVFSLGFVSEEKDVVYKSSEDFALEFKTSSGEDFSEVLGDQNPFKSLLTFSLKKGINIGDVSRMKKEFEKIRGVYEVDIPDDLEVSLKAINSSFKLINIVVISIALLSVLIMFVIIRNTIKLSMYSQRFLIRSMQLVGAKRGFIIKPFFWKGILNGLLSGVFASCLIYIQFEIGSDWLLNLLMIPNYQILAFDTLLMIMLSLPVIAAMIMGGYSARIVSKYLSYSLEDLY